MNDAPKVADAGVVIPEDLRLLHEASLEMLESQTFEGTAKQVIKLIERIARLEAENRRVRESLSDSATVHVNILRGTIALTKAQAIHIAGLPADIEQKVEQLEEQVRKLSAPVSDEEWLGLCAGDHVQFADWFQRSDLDKFVTSRTQEPAQTEGK